MRESLVSTIISTKNEKKTLPKLLHSLRTQCYSRKEAVVADYVSFDGTRDIARSFGARILEVDKPGVGYASHLTALEARGDIIIRTDGDTIFPPLLIRDIVSALLHRL